MSYGRQETCTQAVAETIAIALEHFIGHDLKHATFTFSRDVTSFSFYIEYTKGSLVFQISKQCGKRALNAQTASCSSLC